MDTLSAGHLLSSLPHATVVVNPREDLVVAANDRALRLLRCRASGSRFSVFLGEALPSFAVFTDEVAYRGEAWTRDVPLLPEPGRPLHCEIRGRMIAETGDLLLSVIDLEELSRHDRLAETAALQRAGLREWQHAQNFFTELERQNRLILDAAGEGIYGLDAEGRTTFVNRAAQEMLGWTAEDLLGRSTHELIHHRHLDGTRYPTQDCPIYRSFRFEQVNRIENEVFWRKDGQPIRVEYVSTPIYDQQVLAGAVVIFRDVTERWENERRLREALAEVADLRDRLEQENAYLQEAISSERAHHDILGQSLAIRQLLHRIELVAETETTVLITGEAGTGKALVANAIHKDSDRRRRSLIHFKAGSVAPDAIEAELFGQIRGHSGAMRDRPGAFELAHGGTLFIENVEELPLEMQGRLLHAIQTRHVRRPGDTRNRAIDIRVIAATSRPLEREIVAGRFREDLHLALSVFPIACTPLRERPEDIPELAMHLLRLACKRLNRDTPAIPRQAMDRLRTYAWPGNVRELRNVIERAAIISRSGKLVVELDPIPTTARPSASGVYTDAQMQQAVRENIVACLRQTGGRVSGGDGAARMLGVKPTTLHSRLRSLRIGPDEWGKE